MKVLIGNFKGPQGEQGIEGKKGDTGEIGPRGSIWTSGTGITGTSTIGAIFETSGITDAHLHDYYINTDTGNLYECIVPGAADVAEWVHVGNFKGPTGATGPAGSISNINEQKPTYEEASKLENINSGETVAISFGKLKKALSVFLSHYMQKATTSILGHVKLSNSAAITKTGEYALDAIEKNATVEGTLAHELSTINSNLSFNNFPGGTILEYYQKNPKIRGCFCIRPNIPTDLPAIFSEIEGYLQFFRDTIGQRVLVVYWNYGGYNIIMRGFYANRWLHDWKMISTNNITN